MSTEPFHLIETMLYSRRIRHLEAHLKRLQRGADAFSIRCPLEAIRAALAGVSQDLDANTRHKVRLTLSREEGFKIKTSPVFPPGNALRTVCLSPYRVDASDIYYYHKTSRRTLYEQEYQRAARAGHHEVLFLNERDELSEGSRSNVFLYFDGAYYTPPVACGLLPGIYRQHLLQRCPAIEETIISLNDLKHAQRIYVCNAVRGLQSVHFVDEILPEYSPVKPV